MNAAFSVERPSCTTSMVVVVTNTATAPYRASSGPNFSAATTRTHASTSSMSCPTPSETFLVSSCATMSVPPVLPPTRNTMPMPMPASAPPHSTASRGSFEASGRTNGAMRSIAIERPTAP